MEYQSFMGESIQNLMGVFILILIGAQLMPDIVNAFGNAAASATGVTATILGFGPLGVAIGLFYLGYNMVRA